MRRNNKTHNYIYDGLGSTAAPVDENGQIMFGLLLLGLSGRCRRKVVPASAHTATEVVA